MSDVRAAGSRGAHLRLVVVAVAALLAACSQPPADGDAAAPAAVPVEELVAAHGDAVWRVETEGCGWRGVGSAFAVTPTHLVTNHHVIANDTSPEVRARDGEVRAGRVVGADRALDIAVIEVDRRLPSTLGWAPTPNLEPLEPLVVIGYPSPDHAFTASFGSLLQFGGEGQAREVLLSDAPVERGSSGGPALRGDGTVAGVVTRAVLDDPTQHVTIVHAAGRVLGVVERAIAEPGEVLSDCGLGPDYVPPVPPELEVSEPPPPPESPTLVVVPTTATTVPGSVPLEEVPALPLPTWEAPPTTAQVPPPTGAPVPTCPSGALDVSTLAPVVGGSEERRTVSVQGTITNQATAAIVVDALEVTFAGSPPVVVRVGADPAAIDPGLHASWDATAEVVGSPDPAPMPRIRVAARWVAPGFATCPPPVVTGG